MTSRLILSSGAEIVVKAEPSVVVERISKMPKPCTNFDYNQHNDSIAYRWEEPAFVVFETAESRREVHVRPDRIDAIIYEGPQ